MIEIKLGKQIHFWCFGRQTTFTIYKLVSKNINFDETRGIAKTIGTNILKKNHPSSVFFNLLKQILKNVEINSQTLRQNIYYEHQ